MITNSIPQIFDDPQPWDAWPPEPDEDVFLHQTFDVPPALVPWPECQTNHVRVETSDWLDGELCYYVVSQIDAAAGKTNIWATWLTLAEAAQYQAETVL